MARLAVRSGGTLAFAVTVLAVGLSLAPLGSGDPVAVNATGDAEGELVAVSGTGNASSGAVAVSGTDNAESCPAYAACIAISGTGDADGTIVASDTGDATSCRSYLECIAATGTGNATGLTAVSATGDARSCGNFTDCVAASGTGDADGNRAISGAGECNGVRCTAVEDDGDARGRYAAASLQGNATSDGVAVSGTREANGGSVGASGTGNASGDQGAASVTGNATQTGDLSSGAAVSGTGDAECVGITCVAASGAGDARCSDLRCTAASGLGDADGWAYVVSGTGEARCRTIGCTAVSGTGDAHCDRIGCTAVSGTGEARGDVPVSGSNDCGDAECIVLRTDEDAEGALLAASGTGNATAPIAVSGTGDASSCRVELYEANVPCLAVSLTGNASGILAASGTGDAEGIAALSGTGNASGLAGASGTGDAVAGIGATGTGDARGTYVASGTGNATCEFSYCAAVSGTGQARCRQTPCASASGSGNDTGARGLTPHPPILVTEERGAQGFVLTTNPLTGEPVYRPGSGVVGGNGTVENPYRIEGWALEDIEIRNTEAPVRLANLSIVDAGEIGDEETCSTGGECRLEGVPRARRPGYLVLEDVANVTVDNAYAQGVLRGWVRVQNASHVQIQDASLPSLGQSHRISDVSDLRIANSSLPTGLTGLGLVIDGSDGVSLHRVETDTRNRPVVRDVTDLTVTESTFENGFYVEDAEDVTFADSTTDDSGFPTSRNLHFENVTGLRVEGSTLREGSAVLDSESVVFADTEIHSLAVADTSTVAFRASEIAGALNREAYLQNASNVAIEDSHVSTELTVRTEEAPAGPEVTNTTFSNDLRLTDAPQTLVENNTFTEGWQGRSKLLLGQVPGTVVRNNSFTNASVHLTQTDPAGFPEVLDTSNTVGGAPLRFLEDVEGVEVTADTGQLIAAHSEGLTASSLEIPGGVQLVASRHVHLGDLSVSGPQVGIAARSSQNVTIENADVNRTEYAVFARGSEDLTLRDSSLQARLNAARMRNSPNATIDGTHATATGYEFYGVSTVISGSPGTVVANSTIEAEHWRGVWVTDSPNSTVESSNLTTGGELVFAKSANLTLHANNFDPDSGPVRNWLDEATVDARDNWWGCPDGPEAEACAGTKGDVLYEPWLTSPNPNAGAPSS